MNICKQEKENLNLINEQKSQGDYCDNNRLILLAQSGDEQACSLLCKQNTGLVRKIASKFLGRGVDFDDLFQIGNIGMIRAIRSFDTERGFAFSTYAVPLIMGEIKRFLRDDGLIKVGREQKRLGAMLLRTRERFVLEHGFEPKITELSELLGISVAQASDALEAVSPVSMLGEPVFDDEKISIESTLCDKDLCEREFDKIALSDAISKLPCLWRQIVVCRYFKDMSQQKTAESLSLSQVKVSREEKKILAFLRNEME